MIKQTKTLYKFHSMDFNLKINIIASRKGKKENKQKFKDSWDILKQRSRKFLDNFFSKSKIINVIKFGICIIKIKYAVITFSKYFILCFILDLCSYVT